MPRSNSVDSSMEWEPELEVDPDMDQLESKPQPKPSKRHLLAEEGELTDSDPDDSKPRTRTQKFLFDTNGTEATDLHSSFNNTDLIAMEKRANRFGLDKKSDDLTLEKELQQLYHTLNIITDDDVRHAQFDTIHVRGTEKMNTNDVFEYFFTHKPLFLEWVDENSCNVVWKDDVSAARAMIFYSKAIKYDDDPEIMDESDGVFTSNIWNDALSSAKIPVSIPTGRWRAGAPHPKSEYIFLRLANKSDKKLNESEKLKIFCKKYENSEDVECEVGKISESMKSKIKSAVLLQEDEKTKNPWGDLCKTWGINDSQEVFVQDSGNITSRRLAPVADPTKKNVKDRIGTIPVHQRLTFSTDTSKSSNVINRLGKRTIDERETISSNTEEEDVGSSSDEEWRTKSKVPRMRMHADDEEEKIAKIKEVPKPKQKILDKITVEVKNEVVSDVDSESSDVQETYRSNVSQTRRKAADRDTKSNVYSRLGNRRYSSESDSEEHENSARGRSSVINKVQSNNRQKSTVASTVWSRLDFVKNKAVHSESEDEDSENENRSDLRHALNKTEKTTGDKQDLRDRIRKKRSNQRSPLRIEVTNELYSDRM